jgi:dihydrofolate reductase
MEVPEYLAWVEHGPENEHTTLMGATTYRLMSGFASELPDDPGFAELTAIPKVVFSSTLKPPLSWANTELIDGDAVGAVQDMKRRDSRPLRTIGSLSLCRPILQAGMVDRFRVVVFPVITGATGTTASSTGTPTSRSSWSTAARSTVGCSCSSTFPRCSTGRLKPERPTAADRERRLGDRLAC